MDHEKAARLGRSLFFVGSAACLATMFFYLAPASLAYMNEANHVGPEGVPAEVARGKQVWQKFLCIDCHTLLGDGTQYAPELGRIGIKRDDAYLKAYVMNAQMLNPSGGMPAFPAMTEKEADDLVAFLNHTSQVNLPKPLWAEMKAKRDPYDKRAYAPETNPFYRSYWPPRPMSADKQ